MAEADSRVEDVLRLALRWAPEPEADPEQVERAGRQLRAELLALDVDDVVLASSKSAPPGSKGVDAGSLGELMVTMSASGGVFTTVVSAVRGWLARREDAATVKLTIDGDTLELGRANDEERSELIRAFIQSHQRS
jgi:hypothetical protein